MKPEKKPRPDSKRDAKLETELRTQKAKLVKPVKPELSGIDLVEAYGAEPGTIMMTMIT